MSQEEERKLREQVEKDRQRQEKPQEEIRKKGGWDYNQEDASESYQPTKDELDGDNPPGDD